jgi:hypothetical protein
LEVFVDEMTKFRHFQIGVGKGFDLVGELGELKKTHFLVNFLSALKSQLVEFTSKYLLPEP